LLCFILVVFLGYTGHSKSRRVLASCHGLNFGILPKGEPTPPSASRKRINTPAPSPQVGHGLNFGILLKGEPTPPSAPGKGINQVPPPSQVSQVGPGLNIGMLPKGGSTPPSALGKG
ncbi:hypothetical protein ERO13_D11G319332v2, partial [Gossypium hirsutum]